MSPGREPGTRRRGPEDPTLRKHRQKRAADRRAGLQYDEAGRPIPPATSGLIARVQRLLSA